MLENFVPQEAVMEGYALYVRNYIQAGKQQLNIRKHERLIYYITQDFQKLGYDLPIRPKIAV